MTRRRSSIKCFSKGSGRPSSSYARPDGRIVRTNFLLLYCADPALRARIAGQLNRSEERRVGKECRSRGGPDHLKKKKNEQITGDPALMLHDCAIHHDAEVCSV